VKTARFTLAPRRWFAMELIGDEFLSPESAITGCSPIRVDEIVPGGARQFALQFYHAAYPEGVRDKRYRLQTIERGASFMLARSIDQGPVRMLLLHELSYRWLSERCHVKNVSRADELQSWCARNC
jgi:hypothetical protein